MTLSSLVSSQPRSTSRSHTTWEGAGVDAPATLAGATTNSALELARTVCLALGRLALGTGRDHRRASVLKVLGPNCRPRHAACSTHFSIKLVNLNWKFSCRYLQYMKATVTIYRKFVASLYLAMMRRGPWLGAVPYGWSSYLASVNRICLVLLFGCWVVLACSLGSRWFSSLVQTGGSSQAGFILVMRLLLLEI